MKEPMTVGDLGRRLRPVRLLTFVALVVLIGGIPGTPRAAQGSLEVRVKDHREAIGDFRRLEIALDALRISPGREVPFRRREWRPLTLAAARVDLTRHVGGPGALVFRGAVSAGEFGAVDLQVGAVEAVLAATGGSARVENRIQPILFPFSINPGQATVIVLDLVVMDMSDHPPRGYELYIKGYELYRDGRLVEKIPPG